MRKRKIYRFLDRYLGIPVLFVLGILLKKRKRLPIENIRKILFIKLAAIGDTIILIPTFRAIKQKFPDSELTLLCTPINYEIAKKIPYIDKIINCNVHSFLSNPLRFFGFIKELRKEKYDVVIDGSQWERIASMMTLLAKSQYSIGFATEGQYKHFVYDRVVPHLRDKHELENFLDLLRPLGIITDKNERYLEYFLNEEDEKFAGDFWKQHNLEGKLVIGLHPGCGENGKPREWDNERYIALGKRLLKYNPEIKILITGAPIEIERCNAIAEGIGSPNVINTAGKFALNNVVALVKRVKLVVCSNTGMLHIASCVGTKTLGLHGPTNPVKWGSYLKGSVVIQSDKFCSPCLYLGHEYGCQSPQCMAHIKVDDVFISIRKALQPELFEIKLPVIKELNAVS